MSNIKETHLIACQFRNLCTIHQILIDASISNKLTNKSPVYCCSFYRSVFHSVPSLKVQYEGFCAFTLSIANGLLLASDLSIGLVQYKNQHYAFSTVTAADMFIQNPDMWVEYWLLWDLFDYELSSAAALNMKFCGRNVWITNAYDYMINYAFQWICCC